MSGRLFTRRQRELLRLWPEYGRGRMSISEFCSKYDFTRSQVYQWRSRSSRFADAMDGIASPLPRQPAPSDEGESIVERTDQAIEEAETDGGRAWEELAAERWPNLPEWQGVYLEVWRETVDRDTACHHAKKEWREIRETRKKVKRFDAACKEIEEVFQVRVEDAEERAAIAGKVASAGRYLEAKRSKLAKSAGKTGEKETGKVPEDPRQTSERYAEIFKNHENRGARTEVN